MNSEFEKDAPAEEQVSGDELYISMGLDPLESIGSTTWLIPPRGGGPCVPAFKITINFAGEDNAISKSLPFDELVALIHSLTKVVEIDTLENTVNSITTLSASRKMILERLRESSENIEALKDYVSRVNFSGQNLESKEMNEVSTSE